MSGSMHLSPDDEAKLAILAWQLDVAGGEVFTFGTNLWDEPFLAYSKQCNGAETPLLARFGMPLNVPVAAYIIPGRNYGNRLAGYRVELFGVVGQVRRGMIAEQSPGVFDVTESQLLAGAFAVFDFPFNPYDLDQVPHTFGLHIWRIRLYAQGVQTYLEQLWHTTQERWLRLVFNMNSGLGPDLDGDIVALRNLTNGMELINRVIEGMKPRKAINSDNVEQFKREAYQAIERLARKPDRRGKTGKRRARRVLTVEALAQKIGCGRQTVYEYKNGVEGLWNHLSRLFDTLKNEPDLSLTDALNRL